MLSDIDLADWLDTEYTTPIPPEITAAVAKACDGGNKFDYIKFANVIGLLTLKFKPENIKYTFDSSKPLPPWEFQPPCILAWPSLPL